MTVVQEGDGAKQRGPAPKSAAPTPVRAGVVVERRLGRAWAGVVFAVALGLRLAYLPTAAADPTFTHPYLDALWNVQHASAVAHGRLPVGQPFYRAPGYTFFLAALLALAGGSLLRVHVAQLVVGSVTAVLVAALGARLAGRSVGAVAGLLYAGAATVVLFDFELLNAVLFVPLVVVSLLALTRTVEQPSPGRSLVAGVTLGLAALARPDILAFLAPAIAIAAVAAWRAGRRPARILAGAAAMCGGAALAVAPATLYNVLLGRDPVLISSQGGAILYVCNNPGADGTAPTMPGPTDTASYAPDGTYTDNIESSSRYLARLALGRDPRPSEVSRYWSRRAIAWVAADPGAWLRLAARKAFYLAAGFEIGDQKNLAYFLATWWPFALLPRWWWLLPLAVASLTLPGERRARLVLGAFAATYGAVLVAFVPVERFRLALYPAICVLAAGFLVAAVRAVRARRLRVVALRLALAAALLPVVLWDPTGYTAGERVAAAVARAADRERDGDPAGAERRFLDALAIDPGSASARTAFAAFLQRQGRPAEARALLASPAPGAKRP